MKTKYIKTHDIQRNVLRIAAFTSVILGTIITLSPSFVLGIFQADVLDQNPLYEFFQIYGIMISILGVGYIIASVDPEVHWQFVLSGLLFKLFSSYIFIKSMLLESLDINFLAVLLAYNLIWVAPFYFILSNIFQENTKEMTSPLVTKDLLKYVKTSTDENLIELSHSQNILLVFVRQFGCAFCQETVSELAKMDRALKAKDLEVVYVHMSDQEYADEFFGNFYDAPVRHIADPSRTLYKTFNLKRGTFREIFSIRSFFRSIYLVMFKGFAFGAQEGDGMQLGGAFLISKGQILFSEEAKRKDYVFDIKKINKIEMI